MRTKNATFPVFSNLKIHHSGLYRIYVIHRVLPSFATFLINIYLCGDSDFTSCIIFPFGNQGVRSYHMDNNGLPHSLNRDVMQTIFDQLESPEAWPLRGVCKTWREACFQIHGGFRGVVSFYVLTGNINWLDEHISLSKTKEEEARKGAFVSFVEGLNLVPAPKGTRMLLVSELVNPPFGSVLLDHELDHYLLINGPDVSTFPDDEAIKHERYAGHLCSLYEYFLGVVFHILTRIKVALFELLVWHCVGIHDRILVEV